MRFLVIGGVAWDRPVRLSGPLRAGARLVGEAGPPRLGGGGANAGCALARAGHEVWVAAYLGVDAGGAALRAAAESAGLDLSLVMAIDHPTVATQILIEPSGERAILHVREPDQPPRLAGVAPLQADPRSFDGIYVRAAYPGAAAIAAAHLGPVVAHWPQVGIDPVEADALVGSRDDLGVLADPWWRAQADAGARLKLAVVTAGADGATAHGPPGVIHFEPARPVAALVDATGAGDVFAAGLLEALAAGAAVPQAMAHAADWAKVVVERDVSALTDPDLALPPFQPHR